MRKLFFMTGGGRKISEEDKRDVASPDNGNSTPIVCIIATELFSSNFRSTRDSRHESFPLSHARPSFFVLQR